MPDRMQEDIDDKMLTWKPSGPRPPTGPRRPAGPRGEPAEAREPAQVLGYQGTYVGFFRV